MAQRESYTASELAKAAGIPLRTVRYYVQQKIISAPLGRGPGAHFDDRHLLQLQRARLLQQAGFDLTAIREQGAELSAVFANLHDAELINLGDLLSKLPEPATLRERIAQHFERQARAEDEARDDAIRIPIAEGVELVVRGDIPLPSPKQLVDLAFYTRKLFGGD